MKVPADVDRYGSRPYLAFLEHLVGRGYLWDLPEAALVILVDLADPVVQGIPGNLVLPSDLEVQGALVGQVTPFLLFAL